jgi:hypothetical protein
MFKRGSILMALIPLVVIAVGVVAALVVSHLFR